MTDDRLKSRKVWKDSGVKVTRNKSPRKNIPPAQTPQSKEPTHD